MTKKKKKKKILFHSNHSKALTGFGKNCGNVLRYLQLTGKYEIIEAANGYSKSSPTVSKMPWTCVGTLPDDPVKIRQINQDPGVARAASYGAEMIDSIIKEFKPDIYVGAEDIWAFNKYWERKWWNMPSCMVWTTLDSEPILPLAVEAADHIKHYYSWASFAEREMNKLGHTHVKTLRGMVEDSNFFKIPKEDRTKLRELHHIDSNCFLIGFVFRNQLRKSVPNLLDGFKKLRAENPSKNIKLLLHTHWSEGWDIPRLIKEKEINNLDILTTYSCSECKKYQIKPFRGQDQDCKFCKSEKSQTTANVSGGVSESQLNEVYNLMDVYCHPFTSGGQEIPVQEAKLCELITLVTNYSCGEEHGTSQSGGFPLEWNEYREPGTQFIKASTSPPSICKQLTKVLNMKPQKRASLGRKARQFIIDNYSPKVIGEKLEEIFDEMPYCDWDFDFSEKERNPNYIAPEIKDDSLWLIDIYENILNMSIDPLTDKGHEHWIKKLSEGTPREDILEYFVRIAEKENEKILNKRKMEDFLDGDSPDGRVAVVMPGSAGDVLWVNSLIGNLKKLYSDHDIYFITDPKFFPFIEDHPGIHKLIPYSSDIDALHLLEGVGSHEGFFEVAYVPHVGTQKVLNYTHNGKDKIQLDLYE
jgi:glycosyltransferase involved in cell wall biosynthesis